MNLMSKEEFEIFAQLDYIGMDAEGNLHLILSKHSRRIKMSLIIKMIKEMYENQNILLTIKRLR